MEILQCKNVTCIRKGQRILEDVSFLIEPGEVVGIAGPSGSGKTSLLRLLNLLQSPTAGTISYKGKPLASHDPSRLRRAIGYVLQKPYLFDGTVRDNLRYPSLVWHQEPDEAEIESYLEKVNLPAGILEKRGSQMSGGEQQRVALVRSLLAKPEVLLLDEISASLDEANTAIIERLIREEQAARGTTVLFISHHKDQLRRLAQKILALDQGRLRFFGPAQQCFLTHGDATNE